MQCILGLDVGTSAVKALLLHPDGTTAAPASMGVAILRPRPGWSEQDPAVIWEACVQAIRQARHQTPDASVVAIGLSTQRAGILVVDAEGNPLSPLITWQDTRHVAQARRLASGSYGWCPDPGLSSNALARLLWLHENHPELLASASSVFCTVKDWLVMKLVGTPATDYSSASISGLYNAVSHDWSDEAITLCGLRKDQLSPILTSHQVAGYLTPDAAHALELAPGIPVAVGCGDGEASSLGLGAIQPGVYGGSIGTVAAVRTIVPNLPAQRSTWPGLYATHLPPLGWLLTGTLPTGGAALAWLKDITHAGGFDELEQGASSLGDGPGDLLFIPHMAGVRTPYSDPHASGVFFGLRLHHTAAHLARAIMEGVSFGITSIIEELGKVSPPPCELRMGGGGARSDVWLSVLAAVTGIPVARTNHVEASALGAAMCGAVAAGWSGNLHDAMSLVRVTWRFRATPERHAAYQDVYSFYNRLLMDLRPYFSAYARQDIP